MKEEEGTLVPEEWYVGEAFVSDNTNENARVFQSKADAIDDLFFATPNGTWSSLYSVGFNTPTLGSALKEI